MIAPVFVDTNVLLYGRDAREPVKQPVARKWLAFLWREEAGRTSTQVLSEFYVNATRHPRLGLRPEQAWDEVQVLMAWDPQPVDRAVLTRGRELALRYGLNWWDCQIVAAAELQGCSLLLSEDLQDGGRYGSVTVRSPFTLSLHEDAATYLEVPPAPVRHRSPGRPPRSRRAGMSRPTARIPA